MSDVQEKRRGINLGCGTIILPRERPYHHGAIPEDLYTAPDIEWDNVDRNPQPGVNKIANLFDYPWRTEDGPLPDNTYDVAIAAHIVEHIPHHIVRNGQIVPFDDDYQDGWFAWFAELWRIMKPGGIAYVLTPYAWSNAGMSDPTHTRYCTFATFNYFNNGDDDTESAFRYKLGSRWKIDFNTVIWIPHDQAYTVVRAKEAVMVGVGAFNYQQEFAKLIQSNINMASEFTVPMVAVK